MSIADSIRKCLMGADFTDCFTQSASALVCAEPIVILAGAFERSARLAEEERGTAAVRVLVVREEATQAEADAQACERALRRCDWEPHAEDDAYRIVAIDTTAPTFKERDCSGRYVWSFDVEVTAVRML